MEKLMIDPKDQGVASLVEKLKLQLKISPDDIIATRVGVSYFDQDKAILLMEIQPEKFTEIVMETRPQTIKYQVSGRDDAGNWMYFSIPGNEVVEITTFGQPNGHFKSGIFDKVQGYRMVVDKEGIVRDSDEKGRFISGDINV